MCEPYAGCFAKAVPAVRAAVPPNHEVVVGLSVAPWMARNRARNGLQAAGAVFDSPVGELLFHEPTTIAWLLGLTGRAKPRSPRKAIAFDNARCRVRRADEVH